MTAFLENELIHCKYTDLWGQSVAMTEMNIAWYTE